MKTFTLNNINLRLGQNAKENHLLIAAEELGETAAFLQNIEIVGELLDKARVHDFSFPKFRNISFNPMHLVKSVSKSIVYKAMGK